MPFLAGSTPEKTLKWCDRLHVLIGIARAVHFLHTGIIPGSLYNRLKTSNILLDEHHIGKLSDYGLSIITEEIYKHEVGLPFKRNYHIMFDPLFFNTCALKIVHACF